MDYSKYLDCHAYEDSGLYCPKHRIEVEATLSKQQIRKILQIRNCQSAQYNHPIKELLELYDI